MTIAIKTIRKDEISNPLAARIRSINTHNAKPTERKITLLLLLPINFPDKKVLPEIHCKLLE